MRWAIVSVWDKTGLEDLGRWLAAQGIGMLASGGTYRALREVGLEATAIESLTGFESLLGGRVKTLHPRIHAGILARPEEAAEREAVGAPEVVLVAVNLYPFEQAWRQAAVPEAVPVEEIDIGGVALIRAAAKNFAHVAVVTDPAQYREITRQPLDALSLAERRTLAARAFQHTAYYDWVIAQAFRGGIDGWWEADSADQAPPLWLVGGRRGLALRYGENPHQRAAFYPFPRAGGFAAAELLQGKALSYNNLLDAEVAWTLAAALAEPCAVAVKHQTPCGAAVAQDVVTAFAKARAADPVSIFGGIVAVNRPLSEALARQLTDLFLEVVLAPAVDPAARPVLARKPNLRVLTLPPEEAGVPRFEVRRILGGLLVQDKDRFQVPAEAFRRVAGPPLAGDAGVARDIELAWRVVAAVRSNAIVVVREGQTVGIGGGQTNRIDAARWALDRAGEAARGAVLASDAFFPFADVMELAKERGVRVVVQPGGSIRDRESIAVAEQAGITLLFTGERHFRH